MPASTRGAPSLRSKGGNLRTKHAQSGKVQKTGTTDLQVISPSGPDH